MGYLDTLYKLFLNSNGVFTDTRKALEGGMYFALRGPNFDGNAYAEQAFNQGAKYVVIDNPAFAFSEHCLLVPDTLAALQQLATLHRNHMPAKVIGLTGSNGKTTTKELLHAVLSTQFSTLATVGNLNNHIGVPLTLLRITPQHEVAIIEMGANHQGEIAQLSRIARPEIGCITNYGMAHLEGFGGVEGVIKGKSELFQFLSENHGVAVVPKHDPIMMEKTAAQERYIFGIPPAACQVTFGDETSPFAQILMDNVGITSQLIGQFNANNMMLAAAIGSYLGITPDNIKQALEAYQPKMNRSEIKKTEQNTILMDAYNANPSSMEAALQSFATLPGEKVVLLGDMFELGAESAVQHQRIANLAEALNQTTVLLIGKHFSSCDVAHARTFPDRETAATHLAAHPLVDKTILLKGSRGMALEKLLPHL
ncbi:MAG: UDP-N-acetylmuramoyl-tripeptide--D-alanyl-D-alanine ligase [Schleiferiaceae bacterium]|nr:UDP-N-acetylmuramoyl-tripeptide--D-alanyl-D-alanine ligase [Schleiferiaceae bacterium]